MKKFQIFFCCFVYFCPMIATGRRARKRSTESNCTHLRDRWASLCSSYLLLSSHWTLLQHSLTFSSDTHFIIKLFHFTHPLITHPELITNLTNFTYSNLQSFGFGILCKSSLSKCWQNVKLVEYWYWWVTDIYLDSHFFLGHCVIK